MIERVLLQLFDGPLLQVFADGRSLGVMEAIQSVVSWPVVVFFALVSQLGDLWFYFLLGSVVYIAGEDAPRWRLGRRRGLFLISLVVTYIALVGVLKGYFGLGRPPGAGTPPELLFVPSFLTPFFTSITTASGPGFPSGHALGSALVWGGAALVVDRGTFRQRATVSGVVVLLVSLSRLVLGVHYLVDVVVGVAAGLVALALLWRFSEQGEKPERVLAVAVVVGVVGFFQGVSFDSVAALGSAVGGWVVWRLTSENVANQPKNYREIAVGAVAFVGASALFVTTYSAHPSLPVTFAATAVTVGAVVGAPAAAERLV